MALLIAYVSENSEVVVLDQSRPICGEAALLDVGEHVEEVDGGDELDDGVAEELQPLVVLDLGLGLLVLAEARHDADEHVDPALPVADVLGALVAVVRLPDAAVGERVAGVVGVCAVVLFVARVGHCQLQQIPDKEEIIIFKLETW